MPRIIASAESRDNIIITRAVIYDSAFTLVSPLNTDDNVGRTGPNLLASLEKQIRRVDKRQGWRAFKRSHNVFAKKCVGPTKIRTAKHGRIARIKRLMQDMVPRIAGKNFPEHVALLP